MTWLILSAWSVSAVLPEQTEQESCHKQCSRAPQGIQIMEKRKHWNCWWVHPSFHPDWFVLEWRRLQCPAGWWTCAAAPWQLWWGMNRVANLHFSPFCMKIVQYRSTSWLRSCRLNMLHYCVLQHWLFVIKLSCLHSGFLLCAWVCLLHWPVPRGFGALGSLESWRFSVEKSKFVL